MVDSHPSEHSLIQHELDELSILRLPAVLALVGNPHRTTLSRWIRKRHFPPAVILGKRSVGWHATDVHDWLASRRSWGDNEPAPPHRVIGTGRSADGAASAITWRKHKSFKRSPSPRVPRSEKRRAPLADHHLDCRDNDHGDGGGDDRR